LEGLALVRRVGNGKEINVVVKNEADVPTLGDENGFEKFTRKRSCCLVTSSCANPEWPILFTCTAAYFSVVTPSVSTFFYESIAFVSDLVQ